MTKRLLVMLLLTIVLVNGALPPMGSVADDQQPVGTQAGEWVATNELSARSVSNEYRFQTTFPANAIMVHWVREGSSEDAMVEVSFSQDGRNWSDWVLAPVDEDSDGPGEHERRFTGAVMTDASRHVRLRIINQLGQPGEPVADLRVAYLNTLAGPETGGPLSLSASAAADEAAPGLAAANTLNIISRAQWGADENLRFRNGQERWRRQYQIPSKIVIHHTETPNNQEPMAGIRAVYYFHTVTRGWGDIGYNYIVDRLGRIYEGRTGGDNVIGGHALRYNRGSIGIAVLGSFTNTTITPQAEEAIVSLIAVKGRAIDPIGQSWFVDKVLPNIAGHRDCLSTSCPGNAFYPRLPAIRDKVLQRIGYRPTKEAKITDIKVGPANLKTGDKLEVKVTVTNTGTAVLWSDGPGPGVTYIEGQNYAQRGLPKVTGMFRIGLEATGASDERYAYRWGLGQPLRPGESVTVTGYVQMTNPQERVFTVALVEEYVKYWEQDGGATRVAVTGAPIKIAPPAAPAPPEEVAEPLPTDRKDAPAKPEPYFFYFPETGQFLSYGFKYYWENNGGLAQFGLPLTSEFREVNPADGKEYTVQYFERARFEYHPEHQSTQFEVLLGLLGNQTTTGRMFTTSPEAPAQPDGRYFPETRQWVSGAILKYWDENGGLMMYGYPISPAFEEVNPDDGQTYLVQYFERNRFEYHSEHKGTRHEVLLGLLGRQVLIDRAWLVR